ncbi:MAG: yedK [Firmicutes bacterium]|nr:yedK [Bacillota bacterium]
MREIMRQINQRYAGRPEYARMKSGEIFPTDVVPVLALEDQTVRTSLFSWGFPRWQGSGVIINARRETVLEKKIFRQAFFERRCIIPSTGFFEWKKGTEQKGKDKYLLRLPNTPMLFMAGIYANYRREGMDLPGFVILTTAASSSVQPIHDRMPVILQPDERTDWLQYESFARRVIEREGPSLEARRV